MATIATSSPAAATVGCGSACYVAQTGSDANSGNSGDPFLTIQHGIDTVAAGGTVYVRPGNYDETASGRTITQSNGGPNGPHQFGLFVPVAKSGITIQGLTGLDDPITDVADVAAHVTTNPTNNFGYSGVFIEGDNVTIRGMAIGKNSLGAPPNKTIEVIGDAFTLDASDIEDYKGSVYFGDWMYDQNTDTPTIVSYNVTNNIFRHGVQLSINSGAGGGIASGLVAGRVVSGNNFEGDTNPELCPGCSTGEVYWPAISFNGKGTTVPWFVDPVGPATITGNTFGASDQYIRHRHGPGDTPVFTTWASYWNDNTFARAAIATTDGNPANVTSFSYATTYTYPQVERIGGTIQATHATGCAGADCQGEVTHTPLGGTTLLSAGTFNEVVHLTQQVTIKGVQAGVDARTRSGAESIMAPSLTPPAGRTPLEIFADDVTIDGVTVRDNTNVPLTNAGVRLAPGTHGTQFVNNIVRNNVIGLLLTNDLGTDPTLVRHNLFTDNQNPGAAGGSDIYADNYTAGGAIVGAAIDENTFTNTTFEEDGWAIQLENTFPAPAAQFSDITVSDNTIDNHGRGVNFTGTTNSLVTGNTFTPGAVSHYGVLLWSGPPIYFTAPNSNITVEHNELGCATSCTGEGVQILDPAATGMLVNRNNLAGLTPGISSDATTTVDGTCNWWGAASGPGGGQVTGSGTVTTAPFLVSSNLNGACTGFPQAGTTLDYTGNTSGMVGHYTTLSAKLTRTDDNTPISGELIMFTLGSGPSAQSVSATTGIDGVATTTALIPAQDAGSLPLTATFDATSSFVGSSDATTYALAKAPTTLVVIPVGAYFATAQYRVRATLKTPVVTPTSTVNTPLAGRSAKFTLCPLPSGACFTVTGGPSGADGITSFTGTFMNKPGNYRITAVFSGATDARYTGSTSPMLGVPVFAYLTSFKATASAAPYHGVVVLSSTLVYRFESHPVTFPLLTHQPVKLYRMPSLGATNVATGTLLGTAITGTNGATSIAYKMNQLTNPPAAGTTLYLRAVYAGTPDFRYYGTGKSVAVKVTPRPITNTLTATRSGTKTSGTVTLREKDVAYTTVSNGVTTHGTITGAPIKNATVHLTWLSIGNLIVGTLDVNTGATGVVPFTAFMPLGAVKVRAAYAKTTNYPAANSSTVPI